MLQKTPLLDELAAHGKACIDALRTAASSKKLNMELLDAMYGMGYNALSAQKYQEAQVLFTYLMAQNPADPNYLAGMGHALAGLGDLESASFMHSTAACLSQDNAGHYVALAETLIELKDLAKAEFVLAAAESSGASSAVVQKLHTKLMAVKALIGNAN